MKSYRSVGIIYFVKLVSNTVDTITLKLIPETSKWVIATACYHVPYQSVPIHED